MWLVSNPQVISAECMKFKHASVFRIGRFEWHTGTFHDCKHKEEEKVLFLKTKGISAFNDPSTNTNRTKKKDPIERAETWELTARENTWWPLNKHPVHERTFYLWSKITNYIIVCTRVLLQLKPSREFKSHLDLDPLELRNKATPTTCL